MYLFRDHLRDGLVVVGVVVVVVVVVVVDVVVVVGLFVGTLFDPSIRSVQ